MKKYIVFILCSVAATFIEPHYVFTAENYLRDLAAGGLLIVGSAYFALHYAREQRNKEKAARH